MSAVLTVPLLLILLAMAGRWLGKGRRDTQSIESHHHSLDVLEHLSGASPSAHPSPPQVSAHVRVLRADEAPAVPARRSLLPSSSELPRPEPRRVTVRPRRDAVQPRRRVVFIDDAANVGRPPLGGEAPAAAEPTEPVEPPAPVEAAEAPAPVEDLASPVGITGRRRAWRPAAPHHLRARPTVVAAAAAGIAAAVVGLLVVGSGGSPNPDRNPRSRPVAAPVRPAALTPTTPPPPRVVATSAGATEASYEVASGPIQMQLFASGPCWVELRSGSSTGPILFEGTLQPGAVKTYDADGPVWLRLGDPAGVQLRLDGVTIALPAAAIPFDVDITGPSLSSAQSVPAGT
ncbi:MAG TPA: DUF4115 domain-containing protein [Acidimicrobiales bacterium]|nr:DUF4115 domain-containing protein [Acidimicrobiales bacterium]